MGNVTDSLDHVLDQLSEIEHHLDTCADQLRHVAGGHVQSLVDGRGVLALAQRKLHELRVATEAERSLLAKLAGLVVSQRCENCKRWFEVPAASAKRREYCTPACRTAAWRARQDAYALAHPEAP